MAYEWKGNSFPFISQARRVVGRPDVTPSQLSPQSNLKVEWECRCGQIFARRMHHASQAGVKCSSCSRSGTSRLEFEVCSLLQAYLPNYTIQQNYTHHEYYKKVDLYITEIDMVIELDPYHSHYKKHEHDVRITNNLHQYFESILRIRDEKLSPIGDSLPIETRLIRDAREWVKVILSHSLLRSCIALTSEEMDEALERGNVRWDNHLEKGLSNPVSEIEEAITCFVRNITRPGRKLQYTPTGSNDVCEWKCLQCDSTYELTVQRFVKGTRCPKELGKKLRVISMSNSKFPKLIDTHPEIFRQLVKIVEYPDFDVELTNSNLRQDCLWRCEQCGHEWISKPYVRIKQPAQGCRKCTWGNKLNQTKKE